MSADSGEGWAAAQAAFDPDGLYLALIRFLDGSRVGADEADLPYPPATDLLKDRRVDATGAAVPTPPAPGPRREPISIVEVRTEGLILYASDRLITPDSGLALRVGAETWRLPVAPVGEPEAGGLRRWLVAPERPILPGETVVIGDEGDRFDGSPIVAARLPDDVRVQFRRFSGDALWFGPEAAAQADAVTGPIPLALRGEAGSVWRWAEPMLDREGRPLWRVGLDGLVRPGMVQDWEVARPDGGSVSRGRFLTFTDDKDPFWMRPPELAGRQVAVTVVRDRPRQAAGLAVLLVTRDGLVLGGEAVKDPSGFSFRARDNSLLFLLPNGVEAAHVSVRRHEKELFRLPVATGPG